MGKATSAVLAAHIQDQDRIAALHIEIQDRIAEAAETLRRLPDKERAFLSAGERCSMPSVIVNYHEAYGLHAVKLKRPPAAPSAIDRMHEVLGWLTWLGKQAPREMKAVWLCYGLSMKSARAAKVMGCTRRTIQRLRQHGIEQIAAHVSSSPQKWS